VRLVLPLGTLLRAYVRSKIAALRAFSGPVITACGLWPMGEGFPFARALAAKLAAAAIALAMDESVNLGMLSLFP
jgi:hypothetical protein